MALGPVNVVVFLFVPADWRIIVQAFLLGVQIMAAATFLVFEYDEIKEMRRRLEELKRKYNV